MENSENNVDSSENVQVNEEEQVEDKKRELRTEEQVKEQIKTVQENLVINKECSICLEEYTKDNLPCDSIPCRDLIICSNCTEGIKECPSCKKEVEEWQENLTLFRNLQQSSIEKSFIQHNFKEEGKVSLDDYNPTGDGEGTWVGNDGSQFKGEFKAFKFSKGVYENKQGLKYDGEFFDGEYNGKGLLYDCDKLVYDGEWRQGRKDGKGRFEDKHGVYEGEWKNDLRDGEGEQLWRDKRIFKGLWSKNKPVNGEMTYPDNSSYSGSFRQNSFSGKGKLIYSDGSKYEGDWEDGLYNGEGTLITQGRVYKGQFKDGLAEGEGKLQINENACLEGVFSHGIIKKGVYKSDNLEYKGEFQGNLMNGRSILKVMDGLSQILAIEGIFDENLLNGEVSLLYKNIRIEAKMVENSLNGVGTVIYPSGQTFEGFFKDNLPEGKAVSKFKSGASIESEWEKGSKTGVWTLRDKQGNSKKIAFNKEGKEEFITISTNEFRIECEPYISSWARIFFPSGTIYEGELSEGKPNGWGRLTKSDQIYTGSFVAGKYEGYGELLSKEGLNWTLKKKLETEGIAYLGDFKEGVFDGNGCLMTQTEVYTGEFKNGLKDGVGLLEGEEFDYEGEFLQNSPSGIGNLHNRSKEQISGFWENGGPKGKFLLEYAGEITIIGENNGILSKKGNFIEKEPSNYKDIPMQLESSSKSINLKQTKSDSFPCEDSISEQSNKSDDFEEI